MRRLISLIFSFIAPAGVSLTLTTSAHAADGERDLTFGSGGVGYAQSHVVAGTASPIVLPDGKVIVCNARADDGGLSGQDMLVARFNADGTLDTSFNFDGRVAIDFTGPGGLDACKGLAVQPDGKIIVVGAASASQWGADSDFGIARLNTNGTLDTTFGSGTGKVAVAFQLGGGNGESAHSAVVQPDGKIVVAGVATTQTHGSDFAVARLLPDGSMDSSFNLTGRVTIDFAPAGSSGTSDVGLGLALDGQGRLLVGGRVDAGVQGYDFAVARLLPDGTLDKDFDSDGKAVVPMSQAPNYAAVASGLLQQRDGRIVLFGAVDTSISGTGDYDMALVRLLPDGSLDTGFGVAGKATIAFDTVVEGLSIATSVIQQANGKLIAVGEAGTNPNGTKALAAIARLHADGSLDNSFGDFGKKTYDLQLTSPPKLRLAGAALQGTQLIVSGAVITADGSADDFVMRLAIDSIFADDF